MSLLNINHTVFKVHIFVFVVIKVVNMYKHMGKVVIKILQGSAVHKPNHIRWANLQLQIYYSEHAKNYES